MSDGSMAREGDEKPAAPYPPGLKGDIAKLFSPAGTHEGRPTLRGAVRRILTRPGPLALVLYRASNKVWHSGHPALAEGLWRANLLLTGADIHPAAEIGGGLRLTHTSGLVIGKGARLGSDMNVLHGVTIGGSGKRWFDPVFEDGLPDIGDGTEIWAGAKVLGAVKVGRGCHIGANAVLTRDLPDGASYTVGQPVRDLRDRVEELETKVRELQERLDRTQDGVGAPSGETATAPAGMGPRFGEEDGVGAPSGEKAQ